MRATCFDLVDSCPFLVLGFLPAQLGSVELAARACLDDEFLVQRVALDLSQVSFGRPPAGGVHPARAMFFAPTTAPRTTAMVANLQDGWQTLLYALSTMLGGEHVLVRSHINDTYPIADLEVVSNGESVRYVAARRENRWEFYERGRPREFESVANYERRTVRDRLDRTILIGYLRKLGWDISSGQFWTSNISALFIQELAAP